MKSLLEELKIGQWYQAQNRIFMPIKKVRDTVIARNFGRNPDFIFNMAYLQPVDHMNKLNLEYGQWEVYIKEDRQYLFHVRAEDTIEVEDIKKPTIFNKVFVGFFDYKWEVMAHQSGNFEMEEMKDIINAIREA